MLALLVAVNMHVQRLRTDLLMKIKLCGMSTRVDGKVFAVVTILSRYGVTFQKLESSLKEYK